jgi:RNA polymerase subunit RPABC4/transcription elongation factor Spt4
MQLFRSKEIEMQQMAACPNCGAPGISGQGFCSVCGQTFQYNCANCNSQIDPSAKFCPNCGSSVGLGLKFKDIQAQLTRSETNIGNKLTQFSADTQGFLAKNQDEMRNVITTYFNDIKASYGILNNTITNINKLIAEEHKMALGRTLHKIGLAAIGVGLAVVGLSYVLGQAADVAAIGTVISALGFLLQFISNFISR